MQDYAIYNGLSTGQRNLPVQTIPLKKKTPAWLKANVDFFYWEAVRQRGRNSVFSDIRKMTEGEFVYRSVDIEKTLNTSDQMSDFKVLKSDVELSTHLKHFDFLGIIANAIKGAFSEVDSLYRITSNDEYSTNEYIRMRSEKLHEYAQAVFKREIDGFLISRGFNPNQTEFTSEEEQKQYLAQLDEEVQKLTPEEIEKGLSKNFKVIATDWANNVLNGDKEKFHLEEADKRCLVDYILTGRWFRHYRVGYDYYTIEDWQVEEVFFSEYADTRYPQDCEYIGRLTAMSISGAISKYGHLMTTKDQEKLGDYFGQGTDYSAGVLPLSSSGIAPFAENLIMPFHNYQDHQVNLAMENALGQPIAYTKQEDGTTTRDWMPRAGGQFNPSTTNRQRDLRTDIHVTNATVEVLETYWTSMEKFGVLIYENEVGALDIQTVTEDLMKEFIKENDIKIKKNVSLSELQEALREGDISDYVNTLSWHYKPQSCYVVVIKSNNSIPLKEDLILWGKPIQQQIRGDSNIYQIQHPVGGLITKSAITKAFPYQQLHNICLNQIGELMADELGVFHTVDINSLPSEYKDQTTEETLYSLSNTIKLTKLLPTDPSRANTQGSAVYPNLFQRNEVVFTAQVQYRREMAEYFRQQGFQQVGITPQMLGAPTTYETAEGVTQQATASYALISNYIDEFNTSKSKSNELHIAIAQQCEVNGKSSTRLMKNSDNSNSFIDILAEDPEYFPLRRISVMPAATSKDRAVVKALQSMLMSDNTIQKDFSDLVDIFTNPYALKLRQIGKEMRMNTDKKVQQDREFQDSQLTRQLDANKASMEDLQAHEVELANIKGGWQYKEAYLTALGRDSSSTQQDDMPALKQAFEMNFKQEAYMSDIAMKEKEYSRKIDMDDNSKRIESEKIKLKYEEMRLRKEKIDNDRFTAIINKN